MTNANEVRRAHDVVDGLFAGRILSRENEQLLRSFLPERPKRKTLEALRHDVHDVWAGVIENEWPDDMYCDLETWLYELHAQLQGLTPDRPAHPEFLETEADYEKAPEGTIVARDSINPWVKEENVWVQGSAADAAVYTVPCLKGPRRVLRWGWGE